VSERERVVAVLKEWCKKWSFQLERSERSEKLHWQCRVSLFKKKRLAEVVKAFPFKLGNVAPTCKAVHDGKNFNYVMKADTRVEGPWTDADDSEPPVLTRQLRHFLAQEKRPWQRDLEEILSREDDRSIVCVVDIDGNGGKSIFAEYMEYSDKAYEIPYMNDIQDIMAVVMSVKVKKAYLIDMPRGLKKDKLAGMYGGLETLKNGVAYDKRYAFKKRRFDRPQICVFTNAEPDYSLMSLDRWCVYKLVHGELVPIDAKAAM
jgi:hypothetical protein